jgi:glycerophosphoryl diester phosphodiesterase
MHKVKPYLYSLHPLNIAHRGGMGLAPENTIYAFDKAISHGSEVFELDVHATKDGEIVVIHDDTVDRTTNGSGRVKDLWLAEVKQLDAAYHYTADDGRSFPLRGKGLRIPTLKEVFQAFPDCRINIEIKQMYPGFEQKLRALIQECAMEDKVLIASEQHKYARAFRSLAPHIACSASRREVTIFYMLLLRAGFLYSPTFDAFQVPEYHGRLHLVTPRFITAAHKKNIRVHVWTVNDEEDMKRLLCWGADGIITDYPDRLNRVLQKHCKISHQQTR